MEIKDNQIMHPPQYQEDEIDLFELFSSLGQQWRWLVGITLAGVVISVIIALSMSKQYVNSAKVALPNVADIAVVNVRGGQNFTEKSLFIRYFNELRSEENLKNFIEKELWIERLYPDYVGDESQSKLVAKINAQYTVEVLEPKKEKGKKNDLPPTLVELSFESQDEALGVPFINEYIKYTNQSLILTMAEKGKQYKEIQKESVEKQIDLLRYNAKVARELVIQKIEVENNKKIDVLLQSIKSLTGKSILDTKARIAMVTEAHKIAIKMGIGKPTTVDIISNKEGKLKAGAISLTTGQQQKLFLMGSEYLEIELDNLRERKGQEVFISEIPKIKKQISDLKNDKQLAALKARENDDPYLTELPGLLKQLEELERQRYDFSGVKLYRSVKRASIDGVAEKPKRMLIVAVGSVLAFFVAIFVALIVGAVKRRGNDSNIDVP